MIVNKKNYLKANEQHPFHLVDPSPWPLLTSLTILALVQSIAMYFHYFLYSEYSVAFSLIYLIFNLFRWFSDIITEATFEGHHTKEVQNNILIGMLLFITSEVMFFFSFFWAYINFFTTMSIWIGGPTYSMGAEDAGAVGSSWPPKGLVGLKWYLLPLLNTLILLASGVTLTYAHKAISQGSWVDATKGLIYTIFYGLIFTSFQLFEYNNATFSINDSVYGSIFYMLTGFHGLHVIIGTIFLIICLVRHLESHFLRNHHIGFICAAWYWHFVDVVWIILFVLVYMVENLSRLIFHFFLCAHIFFYAYFSSI